jgi:hypothetical protein
MAKKRKKKRKKRRPTPAREPQRGGGLGFLLGALGFGALCVVAGVLVVVLGAGVTHEGRALPAREAGRVGYWLVALGVVAIGLSLFIYFSRR